MLRQRSDATSPRHTRQHHERHRGPTRAHRASPSCRCSTRAWGPAAVPVPCQQRPAALRHRSVPRHRHGFWQEPDSQHPRPAPPRQEHPPPGRGGHNQHRPGRGRRVRRRAPIRLCAARAGGSAGRAAPPREALPFRTEKGYCMTRDGDASRPAAAPALRARKGPARKATWKLMSDSPRCLKAPL